MIVFIITILNVFVNIQWLELVLIEYNWKLLWQYELLTC